jgi:hypothetical protein
MCLEKAIVNRLVYPRFGCCE